MIIDEDKIEEVFDSSRRDLEEDFYISRVNEERKLEVTLHKENYTTLLLGQSGSGKTWLVSKVLSTCFDLDYQKAIKIDCNNHTTSIENLVKTRLNYSRELIGKESVLGVGGTCMSETYEYTHKPITKILEEHLKDGFFKRLSPKSSNPRFIIFENLERLKSKDDFDIINSLITFNENSVHGKIKLLLIGVPEAGSTFFKLSGSSNSIQNRLKEVFLNGFGLDEINEFLSKYIDTRLGIRIHENVRGSISECVYELTGGIPQYVIDFSKNIILELFQNELLNENDIEQDLMQKRLENARAIWVNECGDNRREIIRDSMNSNEGAIVKNNILYTLAHMNQWEFSVQDISREYGAIFIESDVPKGLASVVGGLKKVLTKQGHGRYRFCDSSLRFVARSMLELKSGIVKLVG